MLRPQGQAYQRLLMPWREVSCLPCGPQSEGGGGVAAVAAHGAIPGQRMQLLRRASSDGGRLQLPWRPLSHLPQVGGTPSGGPAPWPDGHGSSDEPDARTDEDSSNERGPLAAPEGDSGRDGERPSGLVLDSGHLDAGARADDPPVGQERAPVEKAVHQDVRRADGTGGVGGPCPGCGTSEFSPRQEALKGALARQSVLEENLCRLATGGRFGFMAVCTSENSGLSAAVITKGGRTYRCGLLLAGLDRGGPGDKRDACGRRAAPETPTWVLRGAQDIQGSVLRGQGCRVHVGLEGSED